MYLDGSTYDSIENDVYELIEDFGLTEYPLSMEQVCSKLQIGLKPYSSLSDDAKAIAMEFSEDIFHVGGDYARMNGFTFLYNDAKSAFRTQYNIAHEIAHIALDIVGETPYEEKEAEYFAGYLLAPDPLVHAHCPDLEIEGIQRKFGISREAAKVAKSHVETRRRCGKRWKHYEWAIVSMCTVEGVSRTLDDLQNSR